MSKTHLTSEDLKEIICCLEMMRLACEDDPKDEEHLKRVDSILDKIGVAFKKAKAREKMNLVDKLNDTLDSAGLHLEVYDFFAISEGDKRDVFDSYSPELDGYFGSHRDEISEEDNALIYRL